MLYVIDYVKMRISFAIANNTRIYLRSKVLAHKYNACHKGFNKSAA
jgi:hypothetical protein